MILSREKFPLWSRFLIFNVCSVLFVLYKGQFKSDWESIVGVILAFALMNLVAWLSARNFDKWK